MMKKRYRFLYLIPCLLFTSCSNQTVSVTGDIVLDDTFCTSFELSDEAIFFPTAHLENNHEVVSYNIQYQVKNMETMETSSSKYSAFKLGVGAYRFTYAYGNQTIEKTFSIVDTVAPEITFKGVPTDLYIQDIPDLRRANLPSTLISDLSGYVEEKLVRTLTLDGEEISFNPIMDTYTVISYGRYVYTVTAEDPYGNKATNSVSWTIKDKDYNPESITSGALMDFSSSGYTNLISTSSVNEYYEISTLSDEFLTKKVDSQGVTKTGVFKISGGFNRNNGIGNNASFKIKLPTQSVFTYEMLKGKYLAMNVMVENVGNSSLSSKIDLLGNIAESDGNLMKTLIISKNITLGQWQTIYLDAYNAARLGLFPLSTHDNGSGATFPGGDTTYFNTIEGTVTSLSFGLQDQSKDSHNEGFNFYIDSVYIASSVLEEPMVQISDNQASWNSITGAEYYLVEQNGEVTVTASTSVLLNQEKGYVKVQALSSSFASISSPAATALYGYNHLYYFDDENYQKLILDTLDFNAADDFENSNYRYQSMTSRVKDDGMHLYLSASSWRIVNGFALNLPEVADASEYDVLRIAMKVSTDSLKTMSLYSSSYRKGNPIKTVDLSGKANQTIEIEIDLTSLSGPISYLDFIFGIGASTSAMEVTIESMKFAKVQKLDTPSVSFNGNQMSWLPVNNASGYEVTKVIDSVAYTDTVTDCSTTLEENVSVVSVTAKDNSGVYEDSPTSYFVKENNAFHSAYYVDDSGIAGGYSTDTLIQISGIDLPGNLPDYEITDEFDISHLMVTKNGEASSLSALHYHNNITPKLFQPHFQGLVSGDEITIFGGMTGSYFRYSNYLTGETFYYILSNDIHLLHDGNRLVLA